MTCPPHSAPDLYRSYKKSTSAIIKWLKSSTRASTEVSSLSLKEMVAAAETVRAAKTEIPSAIYWAFRDAISNRTLLTKLHKSGGPETDDDSTAAHEHFTKLLNKIFGILFPTVRRSAIVSDQSAPGETNIVANLYEVLDFEDLVDEEEEQHLYGKKPLRVLLEEDLRRQGFIADDEDGAAFIEEFLAIHRRRKFFYDYQSELKEMFDEIIRVWERPHSGPWDLIIKTWLTNVAYTSVHNITNTSLPELYGIQNHESFLHLRRELISSLDEIGGTLDLYEGTTADGGLDLFGCEEAFNVLQEFQSQAGQARQKSASGSIQIENPKDIVPIGSLPFKHVSGDEKNKHCMRLMLATMASYKGRPGNPVQTPFNKYVANPAIKGTDLVIGIQLWLSIFSTYLATTQDSPAVDCRITFLRFAKGLQNSVRPLLDHHSTQHLGRLHDFSAFLTPYLSDKRFDLYFRSPWVAGTHISEILAEAYHFSFPLIKHYGVITAVLHLYNVLVHIKMVNPAEYTLLELLCGSLEDLCFHDKRPESNFAENLVASVGQSTMDSKKPNRKKLPTMFPCYSENDGHFEMKKRQSTFYHVNKTRYLTDDSVKCQIYGEGETKKGAKKAQERWVRETDADVRWPACLMTVPRTLEKLHGIAEAEFYFGPFPLIRTNWFAVYLLCVKVLERYMQLWRNCHKDGNPACSVDLGSGVLGVGIAMEIVDAWKNEVPKRRSLGSVEGFGELRLGRKALLDCAKGLKPEDFQWSF
ncbi:hypothetical protein BU16DRAFT_617104 [Lophium mytilinum]|uniref:DUF6604 domain-containing protein n=1 Tax=Lophium mytilinum TaxID=390894 RepID=A0A6A6QYC3_9PEZI|nr:hypothetical protein BU16DRAFT_617104 [Lophium mytilinum]